MKRLESTFVDLRKESRAALMPYLPLGFPWLGVSRELIRTAAQAGADIIELGMPFSDPLADGPVIQQATQVALQNGMTVARCLEMIRTAREAGITLPLVLMGYYNPILRFGVGRFVREATEAGADGLIVPDLPPEESGELDQACEVNSLDLIFLAAPTSTDERLRKIASISRGFVYLVSLTGVTGARDSLPFGLEDLAARVRAVTSKPVCVGFGISSADAARRVAKIADGVIVGSALVSRIGDPATAVDNARRFILELREAIDQKLEGQRI
jgi:tryptophan synthase alpha chain